MENLRRGLAMPGRSISGLAETHQMLALWFPLGCRVLRLALVAYLLLATFPGHYAALEPGLDASWQFGINQLVGSNFVYGRDIVFTYGPLGFLMFPLDLGSNLLWGIAFRIMVHVLFGTALAFHAWTARSNVPILLFVPAYTLVSAMGLQYESHLLIVEALLISVSLREPRFRYPVLVVVTSLASFLLFIKFSLGLSSLLVVGAYLFSSLLARHQGFWRMSLAAVGTGLLVIAIFLMSIFGSVQSFALWLRAGLDFTSGYSVAMSSEGPAEILTVGLLSIVAYGLALLAYYARRLPQRFISLAMLPAVFFAFKNGFVRQDGHVFFFFPFVLAAFCVQTLSCDRRKEAVLPLSAFILVGGGSFLALAGYFPWVSTEAIVPSFASPPGLTNVRNLANLEAVRRYLRQSSTRTLQRTRLPMAWVDQIKQNNGTVDSLPWELGYIPANFLTWNPNPVIQTYAAYTPYLDNRSASHYQPPDAPDYVIAQLSEIDGRHPFLSTPATWKVLLEQYEVVEPEATSDPLLLRRRDQPRNGTLRVVDRETMRLGEWVAVPPTENLLLVKVEMQLTPMGSLSKQLFRIPPVNIDLAYESGATASYRMIPENATSGIIISRLPASLDDLRRLFSGVAGDRVVQFRITGTGASYYASAVPLTWLEWAKYAVSSPATRIDLGELAPLGGQTSIGIEAVNGRQISSSSAPIAVDRAGEKVLTVAGWAIDAQASKAARGAFISVDDHLNVQAVYGFDRSDVAQALDEPNYRYSGWLASIPLHQLVPGRHTLKLKVVAADGRGYYEPAAFALIQIE